MEGTSYDELFSADPYDDVVFGYDIAIVDILGAVKEYIKDTITNIPSQTVDFLVGFYYNSVMHEMFLRIASRYVALKNYCQAFIDQNREKIAILLAGAGVGSIATIMLLVSVVIIGSILDSLGQVKKGKKLSRAEAHRRISKKGFSDSLAYEVSDIYAKYF